MARRTWRIQNYNAFLRVLKRSEGLSHKEAQQTYRVFRGRLQRPVYAADAKRAPELRREAAGIVTAPRDRVKVFQDTGTLDLVAASEDGLTGEQQIELWNEIWDEELDIEDIDYEGEESYKKVS